MKAVVIPYETMPERCEDCPCMRHDSIEGVEARQCNITLTKIEGYRNNRLTDCPLLEISVEPSSSSALRGR